MHNNTITHIKFSPLLTCLLFIFFSITDNYAQICDCTEYIYLNEPEISAVLKFEINNDGTLTEIKGGANQDKYWYPGDNASELPSPHGLGTDLNGLLYIGETGSTESYIRKLDCDGNIYPESEGILTDKRKQNIFSIDNTLYINSDGGPTSFDICSGDELEQLCLNDAGTQNLWGLYYNPDLETFYATSRGGGNEVWVWTLAEHEQALANGTCIDPLFSIPDNRELFGIISDEMGNMYIIRRNNADSYIHKYDPTGMLIGIVGPSATPNWRSSIGITYSETSGYLYVSNLTDNNTIDCISIFDTNLNYVGTGAPNPDIPGNNGAKAIGILKECCPTPSTQIIDETYCEAIVGNQLFLNDLFPCDGIICGEEWMPDPNNTGFIYDPCDQSITITDAGACGTFTKMGMNVQCGAYNLTYNLEVLTPGETTISEGGTICSDNPTVELTASNTEAGASWQWQESTTGCDGSWTDIAGATGSSYSVMGITSETYYRAVAVFSGNCSSGNCDVPSDCVSVDYSDVCTFCDCSEFIYLNETSNGGAVHKYEVEADGALTEIMTNGNIWYPGSGTSELSNPHGLGSDLNGFLYIGEGSGGNVRKLDCDGSIFPSSGANGFEIDDGGYNIVSLGNTLYVNNNGDGLNIYNVCTGDPLGSITYNNSPTSANWGLTLRNGTIYATSGFVDNSINNVYRFDAATTPPGSSVDPILTEGTQTPGTALMLGDNFLPRTSLFGIDIDPMGNMYIVETNNRDENPNVPRQSARVLKYSPDGILLAVSEWDTVDDETAFPGVNPVTGMAYSNNDRGYFRGTGIVYINGLLYISTQSPTDDCVALMDPNTLEYLGAAVPFTNNTSIAKGIAKLTECCPMPAIQTIDQTFCEAAMGDVLFLNELFPCDGIVCGAEWMADAGNTGMTYEPCDQSITITAAEACGTFTKMGSNVQCGAFDLTYNLDILTTPEATITNDQTLCPSDTPQELTSTVSTTPSTYQWQVSSTDCTTGFSDIMNATAANYIPPSITANTYYRLITTMSGTCSSGMCTDTSNCVTLTLDTDCVIPCITPTVQTTSTLGTCDGANSNNDATISLSSITNGDEANFSLGTNYTGAVYGDAANIDVSSGSGSFTNLMHNTQYTVRVFNASNDCFTDETITTPEITCAITTYSLGNRVFYDVDIDGTQNGIEPGIDGVQLQLLNADGTVYDSDDTTTGIQALTVTTANDGYYRFDDLPAGNYIVEIVATTFGSGGLLETYASSNGVAQETNPNNDGDLNDNGLDSSIGGAIRSGVITLGGAEPTGEAEPASYAAGSTTGTVAADTESNLTVDFGFYRQRDRPDYNDPNRPPCIDEPCHFISTDIYLGSGVTNDITSTGSSSADTDADDGLIWGDNVHASPGASLNLPIMIYNNTGSDAYFRMWIDWNGDGDFDDSGEQIINEIYLSAIYSGSFTVHEQVTIPANATQNQDLALRMRLSSDDINSTDPCGNGDCADDGEVEDYLLQINCPSNTCAKMGVTLTRN